MGLRLSQFIRPRPLWLDEALLAHNILSRSLGETLAPLNAGQMSPLGFLWAEWTATQLAGTGERALRLFPLLAGIAALLLFARVARRILEPGPALLAIALAALSPLLIYYSAEVKSYEFDWLGAVVMMWSTLALLEDGSRRAWITWSVAASFSAFLSTAAPLYVAGSAIALLAAAPIRGSRQGLASLVAAGLPSAAIFLLQFFTVYANPGTGDLMKSYWESAFLSPDVAGAGLATRFAREFALAVLFGDEPPPKVMTVVLGLSALGVLALGWRSKPRALLLLAPTALAGLASLGSWWPLETRLLLFASGLILLALPAGLDLVARTIPRMYSLLLATPSVVLVGLVLPGLPRAMNPPSRVAAVPDALRYVTERAGDSATMYVSADLVAACTYYVTWHPERGRFRSDAPGSDCQLQGLRTVLGNWTTFVGTGLDDEGAVQRAWGEFAEREARLVADKPAGDTWLVIGSPTLQETLPARVAAGGMTQVDETSFPGVRVLRFKR